MIIKSINGKILCETRYKTPRGALEYCAEEGINLSFADLRGMKLSRASIDGVILRGACLWGVCLEGADIGYADLSGADLRNASLKDTCLSGSDLRGADLRGAYCSGTLFEDAGIDGMIASCPSLWQCDLALAAPFRVFTYLHKGEETLSVQAVPLVIDGAGGRLVVIGENVLCGHTLRVLSDLPLALQKAVFALRAAQQQEKTAFIRFENAKMPIPKIGSGRPSF